MLIRIPSLKDDVKVGTESPSIGRNIYYKSSTTNYQDRNDFFINDAPLASGEPAFGWDLLGWVMSFAKNRRL